MAERRSGLDSFCARRRPKSTVGAEESLRRGRTKESPKQESKRWGWWRRYGGMFAARVEPKNGPKTGTRAWKSDFQSTHLRPFAAGCLPNRSSCRGAVLRFGVAAYLSEVGRLELQGEVHQRVRDVSGGFIGDGVFGRLGWPLARHRGRSS
jgi:hypothetical protein